MRRAVVLGVCAAAAVWACTFTRSLDYLTEGPADGGPAIDPREGGGALPDAPGGEAAAPLPGEAVATEQVAPAHLAQDEEKLYWSVGNNDIMAAPKRGGPAERIATAPGVVTAIAADPGRGGDLFVIAKDQVFRIPKAGGAGSGPVVIDPARPAAMSLAIDATHVFVGHADGEFGDGYVSRVTRDGTERAILSPPEDAPVAIALEGNSVVWSGSDPDGDLVIFTLPKAAPDDAGGAAQILRAGNADIDVKSRTAFAVDAQTVYWIDFQTDTVRSIPRAGGAPQTVSAANGDALALRGDEVYVLDARPTGGILRVGNTTPLVAAGGSLVTSFVVDESAVYFTAQSPDLAARGSVMRVAR